MLENKQNVHLTIQNVKIDQLKVNEENPRIISDSEFDHLVESIRSHTLLLPLIVNSNPTRNNIIISGHQRLKAAVKLGHKTVPVIFVNLSEKDERAVNLKMNRISGEFDIELLKEFFSVEELLASGFDDTDLSVIWEDSLQIDDDDFDEEKAIKQAKQTAIKLGDLFKMGSHFLLCGDSTKPEDIKRLVGEKEVSILYCDPIFNINLNYDKGVSNQANYGGSTQDNKSDEDYKLFLDACLTNALSVLSDDAHVFMYCDETYIWLVQQLMREHDLTNRRVCIWVKNNFSMTPGVAFNKGFEPIVYSTRGRPYLSDTHNLTEILNRDIAVGNRALDDILDIFDIWLAKRDPAQNYQHPTQKPITLHEKPIKRCTKIGDYVLDIFGGSGSTLVSCEQLKRNALLCEIDPIFCQVIIDRFELLTGEKAVLL